MAEKTQWAVLPRVRYYGQPIGLGLLLAVPGGILTFFMIAAFDLREHWSMCLITVVMGLAFFLMFLVGMDRILSPFHRIWISKEEIQLRFAGLVLRRMKVCNIRSVTAKPRDIIVRNKDFILHRLHFHYKEGLRHGHGLWMDWDLETERVLKANLPDVNFLF